MRRQLTLTLGLCLLNREERSDYRFSSQKGTLSGFCEFHEISLKPSSYGSYSLFYLLYTTTSFIRLAAFTSNS